MQWKEKAKGEDLSQAQKDFQDIRYQLFDEFRLKPFMEHNSINPSLESVIRPWLLTIDSFSPIQNPEGAPQANYNILRLTDTDYAEDPQCAAMHKKYFSNTMEWLKQQ